MMADNQEVDGFVGDEGTEILIDAGENLTTQTVLKMKYRKHDGSTGEVDATVFENRYAKYLTEAGFFNTKGIYKAQIYVEMPNWKGHGDFVYLNIEEPISVV